MSYLMFSLSLAHGQNCQGEGNLNSAVFEYMKLIDSSQVKLINFIDAFPKDFQTFESIYSYGSEYYGCSRDHLLIIEQNIQDTVILKALLAVSIGARRFPDAGGELHDLLRKLLKTHTAYIFNNLNNLLEEEIESIFVFIEKDVPRARRISAQLFEQMNDHWPKVGKCYSRAVKELGEPDY